MMQISIQSSKITKKLHHRSRALHGEIEVTDEDLALE